MSQVVDLHENKEFQQLDVELLSISPDPVEAWDAEGADYGIETPMLSDEDNKVANAYDVMKWGVGAEPGHTFVLVDEEGKVAWLRDYGDPENGGLMYVDPAELVGELERVLA
jgi:peroxiredoxin